MTRTTAAVASLNAALAFIGSASWALQVVLLTGDGGYVAWEAGLEWSRGYSCGLLRCERGLPLHERPVGSLAGYIECACAFVVLGTVLSGCTAVAHVALVFPSLHPDLGAPSTIPSRLVETIWVSHVLTAGAHTTALAVLLAAYHTYIARPHTALQFGTPLLGISAAVALAAAAMCYKGSHLRDGKDAYVYKAA